MDLSIYSDEELQQMAHKLRQSPRSASEGMPPEQESGFAHNLWEGTKHFGAGFGRGALNEIGNQGSSVANLIPGVHIQHPNLLSQHPTGLSESIGQELGQLAPNLIPGAGAFKAASVISNIGKASPKIQALAKLLGGIGAGGAIGAATHEDNRGLGGTLGGLEGGLGGVIGSLNHLGSKNIAKDVVGRFENIKGEYGEQFDKVLAEATKLGADKYIKPQAANVKLLKKAGGDKLLHSLEKMNKQPSLEVAHTAQSELGKYIAKFPKYGITDRQHDAIQEARKIQNRIQENIRHAMLKTEKPHLEQHYGKLRSGYAEEVGPYLKSADIAKYREGKMRAPALVSKLTKDEALLTEVGKHHPGLRQREIISKIPGIAHLSKLLMGH